MNNKAIEIEEMRISSNGENLEFIINCPDYYQFTTFYILVVGKDLKYSIGESLFSTIPEFGNRYSGQVPVSSFGVSGPAIYKIHLEAAYIPYREYILPDGYTYDKYLVIGDRVYDLQGHIITKSDPENAYIKGAADEYQYVDGKYLDKDNKELPAIIADQLAVNQDNIVVWKDKAETILVVLVDYSLYSGIPISIEPTPIESEPMEPVEIPSNQVPYNNPCQSEYPSTLEADAVISDVSHAYYCLMDDILSLHAKCTDSEIQDRVIRNYLTLYAHQEALRLGYIDEAKKWFDLIQQCFKGKCPDKGGRTVNIGCGCGTSNMQMPRNNHPDFYSNCGCKR